MQALPEDENKEKKIFFWFACLKKIYISCRLETFPRSLEDLVWDSQQPCRS